MRNSIFIFLVLLLMGIGNSYGQKKKNKATPLPILKVDIQTCTLPKYNDNTYYSAPTEIKENDTIPYHWVEEKPRFKECEDIPEVQQLECFKKQLDKHVNTYIRKIIPQGTACEMTQGRIIVQFCINTNGSVTVLATRGKDESLKREAKRIIEAAEEAERQGSGVVSLNGKMIDAPIIDRAKLVLERAKSGIREE